MGQYASIDGLQLYYEIHGNGRPLVLLHGGGSTFESSFGRMLPLLARTRRVIGVELQAHGHTPDRNRPLSFEQDADDVAALLSQLAIEKADIMGFSNGGTTALQIAIRHPRQVNKLVLASATYRRDGMQPGFFEGFEGVRLEMMPQALQTAYLKVNPDRQGLQRMFERDVERMKHFTDIPEKMICAITAPALVINGDAEVVLAEHALALARTLSNARLAILPSGHGEYLGEIEWPDNPLQTLVATMIDAFLDE